MTGTEPTVEFTPESVKEYLDKAIRHWRAHVDPTSERYLRDAACYVDAYQSVRVSLFGELLDVTEQEQS